MNIFGKIAIWTALTSAALGSVGFAGYRIYDSLNPSRKPRLNAPRGAYAHEHDEQIALTFPSQGRSVDYTVVFEDKNTYDAFVHLGARIERDYQERLTDEHWMELTDLVDDPMTAGITHTEVRQAEQLYNTQGLSAFPLEFAVEYEPISRETHTPSTPHNPSYQRVKSWRERWPHSGFGPYRN